MHSLFPNLCINQVSFNKSVMPNLIDIQGNIAIGYF